MKNIQKLIFHENYVFLFNLLKNWNNQKNYKELTLENQLLSTTYQKSVNLAMKANKGLHAISPKKITFKGF